VELSSYHVGVVASRFIPSILNRTNYSGFSGVMTSPYFLQATSVSNPRQVEFSIRFGF
jgi:purine-cytosine permease-like protein